MKFGNKDIDIKQIFHEIPYVDEYFELKQNIHNLFKMSYYIKCESIINNKKIKNKIKKKELILILPYIFDYCKLKIDAIITQIVCIIMLKHTGFRSIYDIKNPHLANDYKNIVNMIKYNAQSSLNYHVCFVNEKMNNITNLFNNCNGYGYVKNIEDDK